MKPRSDVQSTRNRSEKRLVRDQVNSTLLAGVADTRSHAGKTRLMCLSFDDPDFLVGQSVKLIHYLVNLIINGRYLP